jgi:hypothetical protein
MFVRDYGTKTDALCVKPCPAWYLSPDSPGCGKERRKLALRGSSTQQGGCVLAQGEKGLAKLAMVQRPKDCWNEARVRVLNYSAST